jgi:hypothetical protein
VRIDGGYLVSSDNNRLDAGHTTEELEKLAREPSEWKPDPKLDGANLLEEVAAYVRRYVVLSEEQAVLTSLWILHTHALDAADTTPYLNIKSAEKRSGKTRLLEVLDLLVARPWLTGRVTAAVLVRKTAAEQPSLLLDESDAAFKGDREYAEALRGILNAGFRRGGKASLCVGQGAKLTYKDFPVFCPKAIAGIGKLPDTVADRSILIELRRRSPCEIVERFRFRKAEPDAQLLQEAAALWAKAYLGDLRNREPDLPEALDDRAQDIIKPLLAIADEVGEEWPVRAREAAVALVTGGHREEAESLGVRLLRDCRTAFDESGEDRLATDKLLERLRAAEDAPWRALRSAPLDAGTLARMLKPYDSGLRRYAKARTRSGATVGCGSRTHGRGILLLSPRTRNRRNILLIERVLMFQVILGFRAAKITWNTTTRMNRAMFRVFRLYRVIRETEEKKSAILPTRERPQRRLRGCSPIPLNGSGSRSQSPSNRARRSGC